MSDFTAQELNYLQMHNAEQARGGVKNADGSISTVRGITVEIDGRTYIVPTVRNGRILENEAAIDMAISDGLENYPSYETESEANAAERRMKKRINAETGGGNLPPEAIVDALRNRAVQP
jgi:hypothetical protein